MFRATADLTDIEADAGDVFVGAAEIINLCRSGAMFILVDDESRENEGDLVIPAQFATPAVVNFMARHARGLVCLALSQKRADELKLAPMQQSGGSRHSTAFTLSIEAKEGVSTGISAADRAHTIAVAINPYLDHSAIVTPGHVFPLIARDGGVLVRAGHTEAAVDVARLAGLNPSGVICEIMNDDGTMARRKDLIPFARLHDLKIGTIADLIAYRRQTEVLVKRVAEGDISRGSDGDWRAIVYQDSLRGAEHLALIKGDISGEEPVTVRVHGPDVVSELLLDRRTPMMNAAMRVIAEKGRGVVVILGDVHPSALSRRVSKLDQVDFMAGITKDRAYFKDYGIGAQILKDLDLSEIVLLTNIPHHLIGLGGFGLNVSHELSVPDFS